MYILGSALSNPFLNFSKCDFAWTVLGPALLGGGEPRFCGGPLPSTDVNPGVCLEIPSLSLCPD
jgi:hypothetical protein